MKTKVLDFLKNPPKNVNEKFNAAMALAVESKMPQSLLSRYNRKGANATSVDSLVYDLQKHMQISNTAISKHTAVIPLQLVAEENTQRASKDLSPVQLTPFENVLKEMDIEAKKGLRYSQKYSFLKEENAPVELKAFTVDALNSFDSFKEKHTELFEALVDVAEPKLSNEEVFAIANQLLEDFEENRAVHAELEHYEKTREILGEHDVFADLKLQREIDAVPEVDLGKKRNNVAGNITKKNSAIADKKNKDRLPELKEDLALLEKKRDLFDARIAGIKAKTENVENVESSIDDAEK